MSHLLYLNSRDDYPNKCPHICLHLLVKQHLLPPRAQITAGATPTAEAYYTDCLLHSNQNLQIKAAFSFRLLSTSVP